VTCPILGIQNHAFDNFPDARTRPVLIHSSREGSMGSRARHSNHGNVDSSLWAIYAPSAGAGHDSFGVHPDFGPCK